VNVHEHGRTLALVAVGCNRIGKEGFYIFNLIDQNTLDYCYSETAPSPRTVCARLVRQR